MKFFGLLLALFLSANLVFPQVKTPLPAPIRPVYSKSLQVVVVTTPDWPSVQGTAWLFERKKPGSKWRAVGESFPVVVGRNGMAWGGDYLRYKNPAVDKREGDGKSPAGFFPLTFAFGSATDPAKTALPYTGLQEFTECVDDVKSSHYNRIVNRMQVGNFDWNSSEKMLSIGAQYERGIFVGYNSYPPVRGNGSCIFMHIWKDASTGTAGCTVMERSNLEKILDWIRPELNPYLIQMPEKEYKYHWRFWGGSAALPSLK